MKVSVCITVFNEGNSIRKLLDSLLNQTRKANEIIIVDAGSTDETIRILRSYKNKIKFLIHSGCSIAEGRNIAIKNSKHEVIAMTDAGCIANKDWLSRIVKPFKDSKNLVVAGFYKMKGESSFQNSLSKYLGITPEKFDRNFFPSARSIAFRKEVWQKVGGFNEKLKGTAEDTHFNYKLARENINIVRVKNAVVEWGIPNNLFSAFKKFFFYSKGDAESGIWWDPQKGFKSHNIKTLSIFLRYFILLSLLGLSLNNIYLSPIFFILFFAYVFWSYKKAGLWGIIIQIVSDIAVMSGFISGILRV